MISRGVLRSKGNISKTIIFMASNHILNTLNRPIYFSAVTVYKSRSNKFDVMSRVKLTFTILQLLFLKHTEFDVTASTLTHFFKFQKCCLKISIYMRHH